jgi:hypothetical protein
MRSPRESCSATNAAPVGTRASNRSNNIALSAVAKPTRETRPSPASRASAYVEIERGEQLGRAIADHDAAISAAVAVVMVMSILVSRRQTSNLTPCASGSVRP